MISDFGSFIECNPTTGDEIRDVVTLLHPKSTILEAIYIEMACERDIKRFHALSICALSLADYQPGVGKRPISALGITLPANAESLSSEEIRALASKIANNPDRDKFEKFKALAEQDTVEIRKMLKAAEWTRRQILGKEI